MPRRCRARPEGRATLAALTSVGVRGIFQCHAAVAEDKSGFGMRSP
ncbi:MAG: hypothetical protein ACRDL7_14795 [Gaiellaceae bacterium]